MESWSSPTAQSPAKQWHRQGSITKIKPELVGIIMKQSKASSCSIDTQAIVIAELDTYRPCFRRPNNIFALVRKAIMPSNQTTIPQRKAIVRTCKKPVTKGGGFASRQLTFNTVEQCPEGYPRLAALLDSDENFMLYRRFGFLQSRLLLDKQDELRELENDLDRMDKVDYKKDPTLLKSREKDDANTGRRKRLLVEIGDKFKDYGNRRSSLACTELKPIVQLLNAARDLATYHRPSSRDYSSVKSYFDEEAPVCNSESYIYYREDLVTLKPGRENAWLDAVVEKILQKCSCRIVRVRPLQDITKRPSD